MATLSTAGAAGAGLAAAGCLADLGDECPPTWRVSIRPQPVAQQGAAGGHAALGLAQGTDVGDEDTAALHPRSTQPQTGRPRTSQPQGMRRQSEEQQETPVGCRWGAPPSRPHYCQAPQMSSDGCPATRQPKRQLPRPTWPLPWRRSGVGPLLCGVGGGLRPSAPLTPPERPSPQGGREGQ